MTWFDNINDLQYYHQPKGVPCYCEALAYPTDLFLQGHIPPGSGSYTLTIYVYSADGLTQYEDATAYFSYYFGKIPGTGADFFNARLQSYSPAMCTYECYVLRAVVVQGGSMIVFNKYTERYCQNNCCDVAKNIKFEQVGFSPLVAGNDAADPAIVPEAGEVTLESASPNLYIPAGNCGEQLIRIISRFDCIDNFTGDFYGTPDVVLSGDANFEYRKVTTLRGRIVRRPREIKREISYNCKLQRSESAAQYLLEGFEYLPTWKMYEIEGQLHANRIFVDDFAGVREYRFAGGTAFRQVSKCFELFKLEVKLEDCKQRQVFGCKPGCTTDINFDGSDKIFAIPANYGGGLFYNSNKQAIASGYAGLLDYFRTRNGAVNVSDLDIEDVQCAAYKAFSVTSSGDIDTHIYYDATAATNKVYAVTATDVNDLCNYLPRICTQPVAAPFAVAEAVCAVPVVESFAVEDTNTDAVAIQGYRDWVEDAGETFATIFNNQVTFSLKVVNASITEDPADPGQPVLVSAVIGNIGTPARPATMVVLNNANSSVPEDVTVSIDNSGQITYYGLVTEATEDDVTIDLNDITYNI